LIARLFPTSEFLESTFRSVLIAVLGFLSYMKTFKWLLSLSIT